MTDPITPHFSVTPHADGVHLKLKHAELVVPAKMAIDIASRIIEAATQHMDSSREGVPLPVVKPAGDPL